MEGKDMSVMLQEIYQQPEAAAVVLEKENASVTALVHELKRRSIQHVIIAARGTSDNAAVYARYLLEIVCGIPVTLAAPSVFTLYGASMQLHHTLVIGISQSGQATDVIQTLSAARAGGALTACITNVPGAPLLEVSDFAMLCRAGEERAVAATKTYTSTLLLIAMLAAHWSNHIGLQQQLQSLPVMYHAMLTLDEQVACCVERYRYMQDCAVLARGVNLATALETALKMTETSYLIAKPYSGADFLHGPIAMVSEGFPVFLFMPNGPTLPGMLELGLKLRERAAEMIVVSRDSSALELARTPIAIPIEVSELLSPLLYIVPGQLWACHLAVARGADPDKPRGLSKVTLTR